MAVSLGAVTVSTMHDAVAPKSHPVWRRALRWATVAAAAMTAGCAHLAASQPAPAVAPAAGNIAGLLTQVQVVSQITPVAGYDRSCGTGHGCVFGPAWNDPTDHSGCDSRNRILAATLHDVVFKPNTHNCKVIGGYLDPDPYTGQRVELDQIDVDHALPERRAWNAGAWKWSLQQRQVFANDLTELVAVSAHANRSKGDGGLDEYLPPFQPCAYVERYLTVAVKYQLPITVTERTAAARACPAA